MKSKLDTFILSFKLILKASLINYTTMKPKDPIWNLETVVVAFKPPDEYPWQERNSFLYYKIVLCNKYKYNILFY